MHKSYILLILLIFSNYIMDLLEHIFDDFPSLEADALFYSGLQKQEEGIVTLTDSLKLRYTHWFGSVSEAAEEQAKTKSDESSLELSRIDREIARAIVSRRSFNVLDFEDDDPQSCRVTSWVYNNPKFEESYYSLSSVKMTLPMFHGGHLEDTGSGKKHRGAQEEYEACYINKLTGARVLGRNYDEKSKTLVIAFKNETNNTFIRVAKNSLKCSRASLLSTICKEVKYRRNDFLLYSINESYCKTVEEKENTLNEKFHSPEPSYVDFKIEDSPVLINDIAISSRLVAYSKHLDSRLIHVYEWNAGRWSEEQAQLDFFPNERKHLIYQTIGIKIVEKQYMNGLQIIVVYVQGDYNEIFLKIDMLVLNRQGRPLEEEVFIYSSNEEMLRETRRRKKYISTSNLYTKKLSDFLVKKFLDEFENFGLLVIDRAIIIENPLSQKILIYVFHEYIFSLDFSFDNIKIKEITTDTIIETFGRIYGYKIKVMKLSQSGLSLAILASDRLEEDKIFLVELPGDNEFLIPDKSIRQITLRNRSFWTLTGIKDFLFYDQDQQRSLLILLLENGEVASFQLKNSEEDILSDSIMDDILDAGLILLSFILCTGLVQCCRQMLVHGFRIRVNIH